MAGSEIDPNIQKATISQNTLEEQIRVAFPKRYPHCNSSKQTNKHDVNPLTESLESDHKGISSYTGTIHKVTAAV